MMALGTVMAIVGLFGISETKSSKWEVPFSWMFFIGVGLYIGGLIVWMWKNLP